MLTSLILLLIVSATPEVDPEPPLAPPIIKLKEKTVNNGQVSLTFEVTNRNVVPLPYHGYQVDPNATQISPMYSFQQRTDKVWKEGGLGWCGTGRGPVKLPAKGTVTFTASVPQGNWDALKIGISWFRDQERKGPWSKAWSDAIERKTIEGK